MSGLDYKGVSGHRIKHSAAQSYRHIPVKDRMVYDDTGGLVSNEWYDSVSKIASSNKTTYAKANKFSKTVSSRILEGKKIPKEVLRKKLLATGTYIDKSNK